MTFPVPKKVCTICGAETCIHLAHHKKEKPRIMNDEPKDHMAALRNKLRWLLSLPQTQLTELSVDTRNNYGGAMPFAEVTAKLRVHQELLHREPPAQFEHQPMLPAPKTQVIERPISDWPRVEVVHASDVGRLSEDGWRLLKQVSDVDFLMGKHEDDDSTKEYIEELREALSDATTEASRANNELRAIYEENKKLRELNKELEADVDSVSYHQKKYLAAKNKMELDIGLIRQAIGQDKMDEILGRTK